MVKKSERRRGEALEIAILDAAWALLATDGYANLTMEAVAARAHTSRTVLSRRWPDRAQLSLAAIRHVLASRPLSVPDLNSVREELILLLKQSQERGMSTGVLTMLQMKDYLRETAMSPDELKYKILQGETDILSEIIARGIERGEIDASKITPRITTLVPDLLRHELLMSQKPVPEDTIIEVVDTIFLPLVRKK